MVNIQNPTEKRNNVNNFVFRDGRTHHREVLVKASDAFEDGSILVRDGTTGKYEKASAGAVTTPFVLARQWVQSIDANYAQDKTISVEVPTESDCEVEFNVSVGSLTAASVGQYYDLADEKSVDASAAGTFILVKKVLSATRGIGSFRTNHLA